MRKFVCFLIDEITFLCKNFPQKYDVDEKENIERLMRNFFSLINESALMYSIF